MNTTRELQTDEPVTRLGTLTTASMGVSRPQLIATADIPARLEAVFCFLADLENHAAIARGFVELLSVNAGRGEQARRSCGCAGRWGSAERHRPRSCKLG